MLSARHPIDFVTLKEHLKAEGQLEEVGEVQGLDEIWSFVPTWSNAEHYADIVREKELLRKSILTAMNMIDAARTPGAEFADLRDDIERILTELSMQQRKVGERSLKDITMDWLEELETRSETLKATGLFFGISSLDVALGAIQPGDYVVVTAETSGGKSLLAFQGALSAADRGLCTAAFTFEMTLRQLWDRMFSHRAQVSMNAFKKGLFSDEERKRLHSEVKRFFDLPLHVSDTRDNDIASIASKLRRLKAKHDIKVAIVDYLQRIRPSTVRKDGSRYLEVGEVSDKLKSLALELEIVMIAPCQLNRDGQTREAASIEHDADVHLKIVKDEEGEENDVFVVVEKNRQGRRHYAVPLRFDGEFMTIGERLPASDGNRAA
jgi:replicative DNA helicase